MAWITTYVFFRTVFFLVVVFFLVGVLRVVFRGAVLPTFLRAFFAAFLAVLLVFFCFSA